MKLVAAKCPSCGANIDVDENSDSTVCEYCRTKIIVTEAIQKYKLEISGEIEVKNAPKLDNLLKLGDRHYEDNEYDDAFDMYTKALELDPDNCKAILRKGLSKGLNSTYEKFEVASCMKGAKNAYRILKEENNSEKISEYIIETINAVNILEGMVFDYYKNNLRKMHFEEIKEWHAKLTSCYEVYEYLYGIVPEDNKDLKISLLKKMLSSIGELVKTRAYYNTIQPGRMCTFSLPFNVIKEFNQKRLNYKKALEELAPEEVKKVATPAFNISNENAIKIALIGLGALFMLAVPAIFIIFYPIFMIWMWKKKKFTKEIRLALTIVLCMVFIAAIVITATKSSSNDAPKDAVFWNGTNAEDFAVILQEVTGIDSIQGVQIGESVTYKKSNANYSVVMNANNETKEIDYINIVALTDADPTNVFMALNRVNYKSEDDKALTDWLTKNIGKEAKTKIGTANFELTLSAAKHPVITMKTDGSDEYISKQK